MNTVEALDLQGIIHKDNHTNFSDEEITLFFEKFLELIEYFGYSFGGGLKETTFECEDDS